MNTWQTLDTPNWMVSSRWIASNSAPVVGFPNAASSIPCVSQMNSMDGIVIKLMLVFMKSLKSQNAMNSFIHEIDRVFFYDFSIFYCLVLRCSYSLFVNRYLCYSLHTTCVSSFF